MYNSGCRRFRDTQRRQSGSLLKKSLFCKPYLVRISLEVKDLFTNFDAKAELEMQ
jgi:hypothetical protein